jgi:xylulokinase
MVGCGDEHAACIGAGVVRPGLVGDIAGTAEPVGAVSTKPIFDPTQLIETHCHADPDVWLLENPGFVSGGNLRWFRENFAHLEVQQVDELKRSAYFQLDEKALHIPPGSDGVIFLPALMGAMTPTWNPAARGTFFGFTLAHTRNHFYRAILEGSAYAIRDITDQMISLGLPLTEMRVAGGGAKSALWNQIKSDVTGLQVTIPETTETTALGAAFLALVGIGAFSSLWEVSQQLVRITKHFEPNPANQARLQETYQDYRDVYFSLLPVFNKVSG